MPAPPPRAPTFPAFIDEVPLASADSTSKTSQSNSLPDDPLSAALNPSPIVNMTDPTAPSEAATNGTPDVPVVPLPVAQSKSKIRAILLWKDPKISGVVFAVFMLFFYLTLVRGNSVLSVMGMLSFFYFVIGLVVVNANKKMGGKLDTYIARPAAGTPLLRRDSINRVVDTVIEETNEVSEEIRNILYCDNVGMTIGCAFIALIVYFLGMYLSLLTVVFVETLLLFTLPLFYEKNRKQVDDALAKASDVATRHMETTRRMATERATKLRDVAAERSAPLLEKAPPVAKNLAEKIGLTPQKKTQ